MVIKDVVNQLIEELNLPKGIGKEIDGVYELPLGKEIEVKIRENFPGFFLFSSFAKNLDVKREEWYVHLMNANVLGQGTSGAVLGLSSDSSRLTMSLLIDYAFSYQEFRDHLEDFLNTIDYWSEESGLFEKGKLMVP